MKCLKISFCIQDNCCLAVCPVLEASLVQAINRASQVLEEQALCFRNIQAHCETNDNRGQPSTTARPKGTISIQPYQIPPLENVHLFLPTRYQRPLKPLSVRHPPQDCWAAQFKRRSRPLKDPGGSGRHSPPRVLRARLPRHQ